METKAKKPPLKFKCWDMWNKKWVHQDNLVMRADGMCGLYLSGVTTTDVHFVAHENWIPVFYSGAESECRIPVQHCPRVWVCNECNFSDYTDAVTQAELDEWLQCSNCGGNEFHLVEQKG